MIIKIIIDFVILQDLAS